MFKMIVLHMNINNLIDQDSIKASSLGLTNYDIQLQTSFSP